MYDREYTPEWITSLAENEIFVFGCRRSGRHLEGAAAYALDHFGAIYGQSNGRQGNAYAIATAGVDLTEIRESVNKFLRYAKMNPELHFLVPPIGCGLGGWDAEEIAPLFREAVDIKNIRLPKEFVECINVNQECSYNLERFLMAHNTTMRMPYGKLQTGVNALIGYGLSFRSWLDWGVVPMPSIMV